MEKGKTSSYRLEYLDWVRGIGAVIMLQGHVFHSFLRPELKTTGAYTLSQFVGGMPPALFLFLTGVTLGFLRSEEHTPELQSLTHLVCRHLLNKRQLGAPSFECALAHHPSPQRLAHIRRA